MASTNFEQSFSQLGDAYLREKNPVLMKHLIGFQVIDVNDDETKAFGIMAFNLNNQWLYVPLFFLNGTLKGTELLFIKSLKQFVPNDEGFIRFIQSAGVESLGRTAKPGEEEAARRNEGFSYTYNPVIFKYAELLIDKESLDSMLSQPEAYEWSRSLAEEIPALGKEAAINFCHEFGQNPEFADAIMKFYSPDDIRKIAAVIPDDRRSPDEAYEQAFSLRRLISGVSSPSTGADEPHPVLVQNRDIRTDETNKLTVITDLMDPLAVNLKDSEKEVLVRDGVYIRDDREDTTTVFSSTIDTDQMTSPTETGPHNVLLRDGSFVYLYTVFPSLNISDPDGESFRRQGKALFLLNPEDPTTAYKTTAPKVLAKRQGDHDEDIDLVLKNAPDATARNIAEMGNKAVLLVDAGGRAVEIHASNAFQGGTGRMMLTVPMLSQQVGVVFTEKPGNLYYYQDMLYVPNHAKVFPISMDLPFQLGDLATIYSTISKKAGLSELHIRKTAHDMVKIQVDGHITADMPTKEAFEFLADKCRVWAGTAKKIVKEASANGQSYFLQPTNGQLDFLKQAYGGSSPYSGFSTTGPESGINNPPGITRKNDRLQYKTMELKGLDNPTVESVVNAAAGGMKDVLDVSVLTELAKKENVPEAINNYASDIIKALDRIGRLLFLFYWHNEDFASKYGEADMQRLETTLRDVFGYLGDLVIFLRERTQTKTPLLQGTEGLLQGFYFM